MRYNMEKWLADFICVGKKKPLPILSFPSVSLLGVSVRDLISDSTLQAEGMRLVAEKTDACASVSFMDLSVEAECFGAQITPSDFEVPTVNDSILKNEEDIETIAIPPVGSGRSGIYIEAIRQATTRIHDRPVLAGMIGPFSLGARLYNMSELMLLCYDEPDLVHILLEKCTSFLIEYARAFYEAGANGIIVAEPVAGLLSPALASVFASPYMKKIVDALKREDFAVIYHNCGPGITRMADDLLSFGASAYHFGNAIDMQDVLSLFPENTIVMGNLDPAGILRRGTPDEVREKTLKLLSECSQYPNFLLSSGCDIPPLTPWENIDAFFRASEEFYK